MSIVLGNYFIKSRGKREKTKDKTCKPLNKITEVLVRKVR